MSAEQQAGVKRRSSRAAREGGRRRRRSRTAAAPTVQEATQAAIAAESRTEPRSEIARSEARRQAKAESGKAQSRGRNIISSERTEGVRKFVRETRAEINKVVWPDRETTRNLTLLVIGLSIALGVLLGGMDFILYRIFEAI